MIPAATMSRTSTQRSDKRGQQVDDVEVVDEVVGQLDERAGEQRFAGHAHLGPRDRSAAPLAGAWLTRMTLRG